MEHHLKKALVIGATGAVGRDLVDILLKDERYSSVTAFTRRDIGIRHEKLTSYIVDFAHPEQWREFMQGDVLFSALGTSWKQAGSKEGQYRVDYEYQLAAARTAKEQGVRHLVLVSSVGADCHSKFFYLRLKGEIERDSEALGFDGLTIIQPPSLMRKTAKGLGETVSVNALQIANAFGLLRGLAPIETRVVTECMAHAGAESFRGVRRITGQNIRVSMD
ncbi:NAD(P)H-binding protein [Megasphaera stantonii]|uniref:NAD(P)H-binding protein n=1 Tax=Megasphaera stantonii TaxID=2144175 RepID=UPI003209AD59